MNRVELLALVDEARRAPSVHNIQPARWALVGDALALHADPARRLPIADPSGHDVRVSLGAAYEGMAIALSRSGRSAGPPELAATPAELVATRAPGNRIARLAIEPGGAADPLAEAVARRAAYRGTFDPTDGAALDRLERQLAPSGAILIRDRARIRDLAALADRAAEEFLLDPRYWAETWSWLRFSPRHPGWNRDGLNAESMALSGVERALGARLMAPATFEFMRKLGLAGALISERPKTASAGALILFTAPSGEDPFVTGRTFYRTWLEVTIAGLALCPMSALADSKSANEEIRRTFSIPAERRLVNVFRIGQPLAGYPDRLTPRLPTEELVLG